jgi:succinate dehydrogenase / fumarate reductase membrane anchor subunit
MSEETMMRSPTQVVRPRRTSYLTLRVTGVMLAVLALGHYALTHIVHDVANTDASYVAKQWSSALWVTWDGLLLATALVHSVAGLMTIIRDHRSGAVSRRRWMVASLGLAIVLLLIGASTITFSVL